ncbi:MAG: amino acid permease [Deltaproteobacteria bacterium]|nr:MAG: amino acid permease [Deltaproteobacteria bacterium]
MEELKRKYGFWTATAMVIGIVIGSGVFFKADDVLKASGGSLPVAMFAWLIGGSIMVVTAFVFSNLATRIEKVNGLVDYFEAAYGWRAGYLIAWFMTFIYYPALVAVLAWVSARYTVSLFDCPSWLWVIAAIYMVFFFMLNMFSPILAGRWQISTTLIKLIPIFLVAVIGGISGLLSGQTVEAFTHTAQNVAAGGGLAVATLSTAFAYEGWIIATTINAEIKDAKKTLPKALFLGSIAVVIIYMIYYLGLSGVLSNDELIVAGDDAPGKVIGIIFGPAGGTLLTLFVVISCLGTLNGLVMAASRGMYSIASRGLGPQAKLFGQINQKTNSTINSALVGLVMSALWLVVWYGNFAGWFGQGKFMDISELPIAFLYVIYISLYFWVIKSFKDDNDLVRFITPALAAIGSVYIIWGAVQKDMFIHFAVITGLIVLAGLPFMRNNK